MKPYPILAALAVACGWPLSTATTLAGPTLTQTIDHVAGRDMQLGYNLAVNPSTGRLYVGGALNSGEDSGGFKIIDTTTGLALPDPTDYSVLQFGYDDIPQIAVDAAAGRYYILAGYDKQIEIVDAATDTMLSTVDLSATATASLNGIAVNATTHTVYVTEGKTQNASGRTGSVIVLDGATGAVTATVAVNSFPTSLAVDESLNRVYVSTQDVNDGSAAPAEVDVVDGASLSVIATIALSTNVNYTSSIAVNPQTHRVYANLVSGAMEVEVAVIDGSAGTVLTQLDFGSASDNDVSSLAVDPSTNRVFVGRGSTGLPAVVVFDGASNAQLASIEVGRDDMANPIDLIVNALQDDPATGQVYVLGYYEVNVIDASSLTRLPDVEIPLYDNIHDTNGFDVQQKSAVDPGLNRLYTVNDGAGTLTVIDLVAGKTIHNVPLAAVADEAVTPGCVDVNTATHQVYVSSPREGVVEVIDGPSAKQTAVIPVDGAPRELAVDSTRNLVYVSTTGGLVVIDGASGTVVNTLGNVVSRQYFDGAGDLLHDNTAVAVNPVTNRVYVTGYVVDANYEPHLELDVIDGASATVIDRLKPVPGFGGVVTGTLAINTVTNKIYLVGNVPPADSNGSYNIGLYEIDGATDAATAIAPPPDGEGFYISFGSAALAVNTALNRVYIAYYDGANFEGAFYYDVATGQFTSFSTSYYTPVLTFDDVHDRLYQTSNGVGGSETDVFDDQPYSAPAFFTGEVTLSNGVFYLSFPSGNPFGYYSFLSDPNYIYHFDLGYEFVFDAKDGKAGVYFYDFTSSTFLYTSPTFPFPYLYDFSLNSVLYYYPDPNNAGHYNTDGVRYFYDFNTSTIISK